jgi:hypothetical protein
MQPTQDSEDAGATELVTRCRDAACRMAALPELGDVSDEAMPLAATSGGKRVKQRARWCGRKED